MATREVPVTHIVVAKEYVPAGTRIKADMLEVQPCPAHIAFPAFVEGTKIKNLEGMTVRRAFQEGEPIVMLGLSDSRAHEDEPFSKIILKCKEGKCKPRNECVLDFALPYDVIENLGSIDEIRKKVQRDHFYIYDVLFAAASGHKASKDFFAEYLRDKGKYKPHGLGTESYKEIATNFRHALKICATKEFPIYRIK